MAHQAHNLPWKVLSDNFKYRYEYQRYDNQTNLFSHETPKARKDLDYFAKAFVRTIEEHSSIERAKYANVYDPPKGNEELFSKASAEKIRHVLCYSEDRGAEICSMKALDNRKMSSWLGSRDIWSGGRRRKLSYDQIEVLKILLLYNEMDTVLRITSHRAMDLEKAWEPLVNEKKDHGLKPLLYPALMAYVCLNVLLQKPELYDDETRKSYVQHPKRRVAIYPDEGFLDYRLTRAYQVMILYCAEAQTQTLPHQIFFGLSHNLNNPRFYDQCGHMSFAKFKSAASNGGYCPHRNDITEIIYAFRQKGLPTELTLTILEFANYTPLRRSLISDDPLHKDNAPELRKYLSYCWQLLVRGDMLMRSKGERIDWELAVQWCIWRLFIDPNRRFFKLERCREMGFGLDEFCNPFCSWCYADILITPRSDIGLWRVNHSGYCVDERRMTELNFALDDLCYWRCRCRKLRKEFPNVDIQVWLLDMADYDSIGTFVEHFQVNYISTVLLSILLASALKDKNRAGATINPPVLSIVSPTPCTSTGFRPPDPSSRAWTIRRDTNEPIHGFSCYW